jgi:hypothetical protein
MANESRRALAVETDTKLAELYGHLADCVRREGWAINALHQLAGDRKSNKLGVASWGMTTADVEAKASAKVAENASRYYQEKGQLLRLAEAYAAIDQAQAEISELNEVYRAHRWNRYFLVTNSNGHVHRNQSCSTCFATTEYAWLVELADCDEAAMVAEFGEKACTVCFPDAPANPAFHAPGRRDQAAIDARQAEKAARQAVKDAKRLADDQVFRTADGRDRVETVAACKDLIRKPIETHAELAWYRSLSPATPGWDEESLTRRVMNIERHLEEQLLDAEQARGVLLMREAMHEGWGCTPDQVEKIIASKKKAAAKSWA